MIVCTCFMCGVCVQTWELSGFVMLTASVSVFSVLGYVVPVEMYLLHWAHTNRHLSLYGG